MVYKLIATDMDGTLLNSRGQVSDENYQALKRAEEKGLIVVLATGRPYKSASYHAKKLGLRSPMITSNGALVHDIDGNLVYEDLIREDLLGDILELLDESEIYYHLYTSDSVYSKTINKEILAKYYGDENGDLVVGTVSFKSPREILNEGLAFNKIICISDKPDQLKLVGEKLRKISGIGLTQSMENNIEIMNEHVSKKKALEYLCKSLEINPSRVVALGDNGNDLEMLDFAGLAIAMGNAIQKLKDQADFITDTNNNSGWAQALEKFIL